MDEFPTFMRNPANAIASTAQSAGVEGYIFDGADESQMAIWQCLADGVSLEHSHNFDEYFVVLQGEYALIISGKKDPVRPGQERLIPAGVAHSGEFLAGTRTIHAFGGRRAERAAVAKHS
jgi:quercetin dioxygenase-like cupin family protein